MYYTENPNFKMPISKLGFGAMRLPKQGDEIDQKLVNEMVDYAFSHGINYFDTAFVYGGGASEIALGKALKKYDRDKFFLADKMPLFDPFKENFLEDTFNTTLERLGTDYIDFYLMHALDKQKLENMKKIDAISWAVEKKKEGKIKHIGFSIHDNADVLREILSLYDWEFAQIQYNYMDILDNPGEEGYLELLKREIPIIIMEPLKGGTLSDIHDSLAKPFRELGGTNVSYAFRWLAEKDGIITILSGMSNMQHTIDNVKIFDNITPLSQEEHAAIKLVKKNIEMVQKVRCTGCRYCVPCPFGVEIPEAFKAYNTRAIYKGKNWISGADIEYDNISLCVKCGQCVQKCPQHIDIPAVLEEILNEKHN